MASKDDSWQEEWKNDKEKENNREILAKMNEEGNNVAEANGNSNRMCSAQGVIKASQYENGSEMKSNKWLSHLMAKSNSKLNA